MRQLIIAAVLFLVALDSDAMGDVFNMGPGLTSLEWVTIGNPGNAADTHGEGYGGVDYVYNIGKYEVTNLQYVEFLNGVATFDTFGLYNESMWEILSGCKIERSGVPGSFRYSVAEDRANRPVNMVSYWDACRFANWLHNGQPTGAQNEHTTEDGAYTFIGATATGGRNANAKFFLPNHDEWYKAAYHNGAIEESGYWNYATQSDTVPDNNTPANDTGNSANTAITGYAIGAPYHTTEVGAYTLSGSAYGTFDQTGNVDEWCQDSTESAALVRGGSWNPHGLHLEASYIVRYSKESEFHDVGFRVASIPEPSTLLLLAMGAVGLMVYFLRPRK